MDEHWGSDYFVAARNLINKIERTQAAQIDQAVEVFAKSILGGGNVHMFGSGHSHMAVEEMYPRYGSFAGFHPIYELSVNYYHSVVGSNAMRQAMFLENVEGLGRAIMQNYHCGASDSLFVISQSGTTALSVDIALAMRAQRLPVVALTSVEHCQRAQAKHSTAKKLTDVADVIIDNCAPGGDAAIHVNGLESLVGPLSTVGNTVVVNVIKSRLAARLTAKGSPPTVITSSTLVGDERAQQLFESSYEEYWRRTRSL